MFFPSKSEGALYAYHYICFKHLNAWTVGKVVKFIREVQLPDGSHLLGGLVDQKALTTTNNSQTTTTTISNFEPEKCVESLYTRGGVIRIRIRHKIAKAPLCFSIALLNLMPEKALISSQLCGCGVKHSTAVSCGCDMESVHVRAACFDMIHYAL